MSDYHPFQESLNPRLENACERCGRLPSASCHISLLDRVEALREAYLDKRLTVEELAMRLPNGWDLDRKDDPDGTGRHLTLLIVGHLAEFQMGNRDETEVRAALAATR